MATLYTLVNPRPPIPVQGGFICWFVLNDQGDGVYYHPDLDTAASAAAALQAGEAFDNLGEAIAQTGVVLPYTLAEVDRVETEYLAASAELAQATASLEATLNRVEARLAAQPVATPARPGRGQRQGQGWFSRFVADFVVLIGFRRGKPYVRPYLRLRQRLWGR